MFGTKQIGKKAQKAAKKAPAPVKAPVKKAKAVAKKAGSVIRKAPVPPATLGGARAGGAGYRRYEGDALWLPNTQRPEWLDGSLPGDRGFDPLGLGKPAEYLQVDIDELDQNAATNKPGQILGAFTSTATETVSSANKLSPYDEVFGIERFRECELIHGRWAMLACLGCLIGELTTGVSWVEVGKVQLDGASYLGNPLPFSVSQLTIIEALLVGGAEIYRNGETDTTKRCYPGGVFDPLKLSESKNGERLKEAEIKHARLAMIAFLGYGVQALTTGEGVLGSLAKFANSF